MRATADKRACDIVVNEGGGDAFEFGGAALRVGVAEKGVFRFTLTTRGSAGHASIPRIGDNALSSSRPSSRRCPAGVAGIERSAESDALVHALGLDPDDLAGAPSLEGSATRALRCSSSRCWA